MSDSPSEQRPVKVRSRTGRLHDVLLGNNPRPTKMSGWHRLSQRRYDLAAWDYGPSNWNIACNVARIGPATVGWIHRSDGSHGHLAGLIVFTHKPDPVAEPGGSTHYCDGLLWRLPREWWIDGARVTAHPAWTNRAPFGPTRRFRNGEELSASCRAVLASLLHPVAREWLDVMIRHYTTEP